jgi:ABC-type multidrug transport system fused ATPase/permease subunit
MEEENAKTSPFKRLYPLNKPRYLIFTGVLGSIISGAAQPILGIMFAYVMTYLTADATALLFLAVKQESDMIEMVNGFPSWKAGVTPQIFMADGLNFAILGMIGIAVTFMFTGTMQKTSFSILGENTAEIIRRKLYTSILTMNIGWFDEKENATSILTSAMASDTAIVNGVSTESLAPQLEGNFALFAGIGIGFWACWQESVVMIFVAPFLMLGGLLEMKF